MSSSIHDNALQLWLQDVSDYPYTTSDALRNMYSYFQVEDLPSPTGSSQGDEDESGGNNINVDALSLLKLIQDDDQKHCFLTFRKDDNGNSTALLLHHMARFPARLGESSPFAGNWYMTGGEPVGGVHITYDTPRELFCVTTPTQTYSIDRIQRELANELDLTTLVPEPTTENLQDLDLVTTRRTMWIPNQYAALCVGEDLSPAEVFTRIYGAMRTDGLTEACKPLVDFLRVQLLGGDTTNSAAFLDSELTQPRSTTALIRHCNTVLESLFNTSHPIPSQASIIQGMTLQDLKEFMAAVRDGQSVEPSIPQSSAVPLSSVQKRWKVNLPTLLKFAHTTSADNLAPIWSALAAVPKKEERIILQAALDDFALSSDSATNVKLVVDKPLCNTVVNLMIFSCDPDR